jgi:uncharacterized protein (TIGR02246 family)
MRKLLLIGVAALALNACEVRKENAPSEQTAVSPAGAISQAEAEKIVADANASFTGGDAFKIMEFYAPGAVMFDPTHVEPTGDRAIQTKWAADFVAMKPSDLVTQMRAVQILDGDTIVASGIAAFLANVGPNRQRLSTRYTQVFERQADGSWKIVHEHMSLPPAPPGPGV